MGARQKLNKGYMNGSLLLAGVLGWFADSWAVFLLTLGALLGLNLWQGEIRLKSSRQDHARQRRQSPHSRMEEKHASGE